MCALISIVANGVGVFVERGCWQQHVAITVLFSMTIFNFRMDSCATRVALSSQWCEQDPRCNRLLLSDLLIAPLQHCTKMPLLLTSVSRYTENEEHRKLLVKTQKKLETSISEWETIFRFSSLELSQM